MTTDATIGRVVRPRGKLTDRQRAMLADSRLEMEDAQAHYRAWVLAVLTEGASFSEVSAFTGLSTNTLQRWKREAKA